MLRYIYVYLYKYMYVCMLKFKFKLKGFRIFCCFIKKNQSKEKRTGFNIAMGEIRKKKKRKGRWKKGE